jgi:hypothetical protein
MVFEGQLAETDEYWQGWWKPVSLQCSVAHRQVEKNCNQVE